MSIPNKRRKMEPDISNPVPGSIVKIELQNFMCHTFFEIELSPSVNFIVGRNGSGKSAILMALVIGLGGKSSATNRAPNMTEFIKQGSSWGQVAITIHNSSENGEAFHRELYGDKVIVERRITKNGSSYKLKSHDGKTISNSKKDLTLMLDHYNIQVNNPVSILNQEMSKMFLASTDPGDKYKFFMKSTHLEQMVEDYQMINEKKDTTKHTLDRKKKALPDLRQQVRQLEAQYKEIAELRTLGSKVSTLKDELIWSKVKIVEDELTPLTNDLTDMSENKLPVINAKLAEKNEQFKRNEAAVKAVEAESRLEMERYSTLETDQMTLRQQAQAKKRSLQENRHQQKRLQRQVQEHQADKRHLLQKIKEIHDTNLTRNRAAERETRQQELAECNQRLEECTRQMTETTTNLEALNESLSQINEEIGRIKDDGDQFEREKKAREGQLKTMREATRNRVKVFGNYMPALLKRIDECTRFHRKPRGPFGLNITVRDQKWANVIEMAIGSLMMNFVVHDQHDKQILSELFRQTCEGRWPNLIVMKFRDDFYDVSQKKPSVGYPTVLDMLDIKDNMISNALIEQCRIEQCLLIENNEEARRVIMGHAPRNVFQGYTLSGDTIKEQASYSGSIGNRTSKYFQNDPTAAIQQLSEQISSVSNRLNQQRAMLSTLEKDANKIRTLYRNDQNKQRTQKTELSKWRMRFSELDNLEDVPLIDARALEEEVAQEDAQIEEISVKLRELVTKDEELRLEYEEADQKHTESINRDSGITNKLEELRNSINTGQQQLNKVAAAVEVWKQRKKNAAEQIKTLTAKVREKEAVIAQKTELSLQRCPRVEVTRPARNLEQQIIALERRIEQGTRSNANVEEITRRFYTAKQKYQEIVKNTKDLNAFIVKLGNILGEREERYFKFRKEVTMQMKYFFMMNLSQRGYTGKLVVDHDKKHLKMQLNVDTSGASQEVHDVRTLSGGERSYSTVCFICSIWNIMESPFRCLDEFDVFMDLYNRRITMTMIMDHAYSASVSRQYILFTPQDMSAITKKHKHAKVFQLEAPERGEEAED